MGMRHVAALLTLMAFILVTAAYVPRNHFKARLGHPMVLGTKAWALGHLLANGNLADMLLFGGFLAWAIADFASLRRRDRAAGAVATTGTARGTGLTVLLGVVLWSVFAFALHGPLVGVRPLG
jgi:uncharacterized membrane protein